MNERAHRETVTRVLRSMMARRKLKHADLVHDGAELRTIQRFLPQRPGTVARDIPGTSIDAMIQLLGTTHAAFYRALAKRSTEPD